jgi:hypothetical protein
MRNLRPKNKCFSVSPKTPTERCPNAVSFLHSDTKYLQAFCARDFMTLLSLGGFPEPFYAGSETEARRWSRDYRSRLLEENLSGLESVHDIGSLEQMMIRLPDLVGSPLSLNALREDLQLVENRQPVRFIECKWADDDIHPALRYASERFPKAEFWQITAVGTKDFRTTGGMLNAVLPLGWHEN